MGNLLQTAGNNIKKNMSVQNLQNAGWTIAGGLFSRLLPTAIQGMSNGRVDMTGMKGTVVSLASSILLGAAIDRPYFIVGSVGVETIKLVYAHANDTIAATFGTPIVAYDKNAIAAPVNAQLQDVPPPGTQEITAPDGSKMLVRSRATMPESRISDYLNPNQLPGALNDYVHPKLKDYISKQKMASMGDYVKTANITPPALSNNAVSADGKLQNSFNELQDAVANGSFV